MNAQALVRAHLKIMTIVLGAMFWIIVINLIGNLVQFNLNLSQLDQCKKILQNKNNGLVGMFHFFSKFDFFTQF